MAEASTIPEINRKIIPARPKEIPEHDGFYNPMTVESDMSTAVAEITRGLDEAPEPQSFVPPDTNPDTQEEFLTPSLPPTVTKLLRFPIPQRPSPNLTRIPHQVGAVGILTDIVHSPQRPPVPEKAQEEFPNLEPVRNIEITKDQFDSPTTEIAKEEQAEIALNTQESQETYGNFLSQEIFEIPELRDKHKSIYQAGVEIIDNYGIRSEFFADKGAALVFTSLASRWIKASDSPPEQAFLENALILLAHSFSAKLNKLSEKDFEKKGYSAHYIAQVIDRYTDQTMSDKLRAAIQDGLLDHVKNKLKITSENEDPYEIVVLTISDQPSSAHLGELYLPEWQDMPWMGLERVNEARDMRDTLSKYDEELEKRREALVQELGTTAFGTARVQILGKRKLLCLPLLLAERILDPDFFEDHFSDYGSSAQKREKALLEHEYVHTQGGWGDTNFGISLEELRAEEFSGNQAPVYHEVRAFFRSKPFHDKNIIKQLFNQPKGGNSFTVYKELAIQFGIDRMLEIVMVRPSIYNNTNNESHLRRDVAQYLGGYEEVKVRLLRDLLEEDKIIENEPNQVEQNNSEEVSTSLSKKNTQKKNLLNKIGRLLGKLVLSK